MADQGVKVPCIGMESRGAGVFFFLPFPPLLLFPAGNKLGKALSLNDPSQGFSLRKSLPWETDKDQSIFSRLSE